MPRSRVPITGAVLTWACEENGLSTLALAERLRVPPDLLDEWESGETEPSRGQFSALVDVLKRPSAVVLRPGTATAIRVGDGASLCAGPRGHELTQPEVTQIRWVRRLQEAAMGALHRR